MRVFDWICAVVAFALGVVHCALTPAIYRAFSLSALWFFGTGLALIFVGMLNVLRLTGPDAPLLRVFCIAANASVLLLAVLFALKVNLAHNPQGVVLLVSLGGELLFSLVRRR